jgi:hypothetical protein
VRGDNLLSWPSSHRPPWYRKASSAVSSAIWRCPPEMPWQMQQAKLHQCLKAMEENSQADSEEQANLLPVWPSCLGSRGWPSSAPARPSWAATCPAVGGAGDHQAAAAEAEPRPPSRRPAFGVGRGRGSWSAGPAPTSTVAATHEAMAVRRMGILFIWPLFNKYLRNTFYQNF